MSTSNLSASVSGAVWPPASPALTNALDRQVGLDARTRRGFSNHLPMELVALDAMGAPPARLEAMLAGWEPELSPREDTTVFDAFRAEIAADGIDATVDHHLPRLAHMPASEWFHSMIRLAYALDAGHPGQVASALADWVAYGRALPGEAPEGGTSPALEVLRTLGGAALEPGRGHADLAAVAGQHRFQEAIRDTVVDDALDDLAAAAAAAHVAGGDLATLHMVTGTQAARSLLPRLGSVDRRRLARRAVQAVAAGYVAAGRPDLPATEDLDVIRGAEVPAWEDVRAAAVTSPDVHVTKLVYTCRIEGLATGDPLYGWLAARQVGLA